MLCPLVSAASLFDTMPPRVCIYSHPSSGGGHGSFVGMGCCSKGYRPLILPFVVICAVMTTSFSVLSSSSNWSPSLTCRFTDTGKMVSPPNSWTRSAYFYSGVNIVLFRGWTAMPSSEKPLCSVPVSLDGGGLIAHVGDFYQGVVTMVG